MNRSHAVLPAALLLAALANLFFWWTARPPAEGSPEVQFARDMAAHHTQAVEMAIILGDRTANTDLRQFALDLVLRQQTQIGQMQGWLASWRRPLAGVIPPMAGHASMMGMASQEQINALRTLPMAEAEVAFLQLMIRHHQGGIAMAEDVLRQTQRPEVVCLAQAIVNGQRSKVAYLAAFLEQRGVTPTPAPHADHAQH